jgi:RNA polymerase sigma-70 factor (ECF subfamily)
MPTRNPLSIVEKCKKGDEKAFAILCEENYDFAYRIAFRMLAHEEDVKDVVQEAFIKVWKNICSYNEQVKITTWLYSIVTNLCIDRLRKRKNHADILCEEALGKVNLTNEEEQLEKKDLAAIITCIAKHLSPKQHAIFVLRDLEGLDMEEISRITQLPASRVKSNLCHARKAIREKLVKNYKVEY